MNNCSTWVVMFPQATKFPAVVGAEENRGVRSRRKEGRMNAARHNELTDQWAGQYADVRVRRGR